MAGRRKSRVLHKSTKDFFDSCGVIQRPNCTRNKMNRQTKTCLNSSLYDGPKQITSEIHSNKNSGTYIKEETMKLILITIILAFVIAANSQVLTYPWSSPNGLDDYDSHAGSVTQTSPSGCPSGNCLKVGNTKKGNNPSVNGNVIALFSTSGAEGCEIRFYAHTSGLDSGDTCILSVTLDGGATWTPRWTRYSTDIDDWEFQSVMSLLSFDFDNTTLCGIKYGPGVDNGKRDYCWIDSADIRCYLI